MDCSLFASGNCHYTFALILYQYFCRISIRIGRLVFYCYILIFFTSCFSTLDDQLCLYQIYRIQSTGLKPKKEVFSDKFIPETSIHVTCNADNKQLYRVYGNITT
jgi:hypothetical protein